jgi:hypothetical protein
MKHIEHAQIVEHARQLRALEMQQHQGLMAEQGRLYLKLLAASVLSGLLWISEILRPLFSWNPRAPIAAPHYFRCPYQTWLTQIHHFARGLFAWNPRPY